MVKKILCIDADMAAVQKCVNGLRKLEPEILTDFCESLDEGQEFFKENYYGLIIIDLSILNKDILEFIEDIRRGNFYGDIIFTGNYKDPSTLKKMEVLKEIEVLLKPFDIEWFVSRIDKYFRENISIGNRIDSIGPCFFMRLLNLGSCTITCKISKDDKTGMIFFENGQIVNAKSWKNSGELALVDLLDLADARIDIIGDKKSISRKINMDFNSLISVVSSQSSKGCIDRVASEGSDNSGFIEFIIDEMKNTGKVDGEMIVNNAIQAMGLNTLSFPSDSEIDLIEHVSGGIKDKSKLLK
ncbi:MAG: DUF4388 domain-containing protein, partial [Candidatus Aminicenantes bacterium]|nr:DUF4388 domain-containing protein [Candidatus Aminicenantes bacterium]